MLHNSDSHQLLAVVTAVHHQGAGESLHYRALSFPESLDREPAGRVGQVLAELVLMKQVYSTNILDTIFIHNYKFSQLRKQQGLKFQERLDKSQLETISTRSCK